MFVVTSEPFQLSGFTSETGFLDYVTPLIHSSEGDLNDIRMAIFRLCGIAASVFHTIHNGKSEGKKHFGARSEPFWMVSQKALTEINTYERIDEQGWSSTLEAWR